MSRRTISWLVAALLVIGLLSWVTQKRRYSTVEDGGYQALLETPIDPAAVQSFTAWLGSKPDSTITLARSDDGWVVASRWNWPAKKDLVDQLLGDLEKLKGERRASSEDVLADFEIGEENGMHLVGKGSGDTELFHLVVGKTALRGGSFARLDGSNDVYLVPASLRSPFGVFGEEPKAPDARRWLELRIHRAERNEVDALTLDKGGKTLVLEKVFAEPAEGDSTDGGAGGGVDRTQWTWKPDAAGAFDKAKTDGILSTLANLYASDPVEPVEDWARYGLADASRKVTLRFQDGHTVTVAFGSTSPEDEKKTYVRVDDGLPALIYTSTVDRVFPDRAELKPAES
jgi:hypothetical protein